MIGDEQEFDLEIGLLEKPSRNNNDYTYLWDHSSNIIFKPYSIFIKVHM